MSIYRCAPCLRYGWDVLFALGLIGINPFPGMAQITPDDTLGNERSRVNRNVQIRGRNVDRIEGGATRGSNLFHSFQEFNVNEGQRVYFANPSGIANILSRVTGRDVSDIMGTLGVEGGANLFLLNPNGIIFGPNAQLDISGSFFSSTADSFTFPDGTQFSATNPRDSSLLSVNVPLGVQYGPNAPGAITNAGTLSVGQNFRLSGGSVTSTGLLSAPSGQLLVEGVAGNVQIRNAVAQTATLSASNNLFLQDSQLQTTNDLNLFAGNTVQVRDSVANPFVAYAGGNLTIQGNQNIDIFALNHPSSGLVSGGDMVLRSANTVGGDAHYWSGGNFRIEQLDGDLGNLFSPYDPVIRTNGSVRFDSYTGGSLHIHAGGSVTIDGNVTINSTAPDGLPEERVTVPDPTGTASEQITINGQEEATLDIRSGVTVANPSPPPFNIPGATPQIINPVATSGVDIRIGSITNNTLRFEGAPPIFGRVYLRSEGSVVFTNTEGIDAGNGLGSYSIVAFGNPVTISAQGDVRIPQGIITGANFDVEGELGNITIFSGGRIDTTNGGTTSGGLTSFVNSGNSGNVTLRAIGAIETGDISSRVLRVSGNTGTGFGGSINIESRDGQVSTGAIESSTSNTGSTQFRNGDIRITADGRIETGDLSTRVIETGFAGEIVLNSTNGQIQTGTVTSSTSNTGSSNFRNPGITITARGDITTDDVQSFVGIVDYNQDDNRDNVVGGFGNAGPITLMSDGRIEVNGRVASFTGNGNGGNITLIANGGDIETFGIRSFVGNITADIGPIDLDNPVGGDGNAGDITLRSSEGINVKGRIISFAGSDENNTGFNRGGNIEITANDGDIEVTGIRSFVGSIDLNENLNQNFLTGVLGNAGNITLTANGGITATDTIASFAGGQGRGGRIFLTANDGAIEANGFQSFVGTFDLEQDLSTGGFGNAGNITLDASGTITVNGRIDSFTGVGQGGQISLTAGDSITNTGRIASFATGGANGEEGNGGDISLYTGNGYITTAEIISAAGTFALDANGDISDFTGGNGTAGDITLVAGGAIDTGGIASFAGGDSNPNTRDSGNVSLFAGRRITTDSINSTAGSNSTPSNRIAGNIRLEANGRIMVDGDIESFANGTGGNITFISENGGINTTAGALRSSTFSGQGGNIRLQADRNIRTSNIESFVDGYGEGDSGNIRLRSRNGSINTTEGDLQSSTPEGNAGNVSLRAYGDIDTGNISSFVGFDQPQEVGRTGNAGDITLDSITGDITVNNSNLLAFIKSNEPDRDEDGNFLFSEILLTSRQGSVFLNGARLSTTNTGSAFAGDINIRAADNIQINSSTLESQGFVGRISIRSNDKVSITNSSTLDVSDEIEEIDSSLNSDQSGLISIEADSVAINNNSRLRAVIDTNEDRRGGEIEITAANSLLLFDNLEDQQVISARAFGDATGGNVTLNIRDGFIATNEFDDTDIVANAEAGDGGRIEINTNQIFGFRERRDTPFSDLDASSESGAQGIITLNTLNVDPTRGLGELETEIVDASNLVAEGCVGSDRRGVDTQGEFTRTGRGGLSPDPTGTLTDDSLIDQFSPANTVDRSSTVASDPSEASQSLVEAQGLARNASGKVSLVPGSSNSSLTLPGFTSNTCDAP